MSDRLQSPGNAAMLACGWLGETVCFFVVVFFCLTDREFNQSFLWRFLLFPFTKLPILGRNKYVIARTKRKRPPLVRVHHWSPASIDQYLAGTCRKHGVVLMSMRRDYVALTSIRRHFSTKCSTRSGYGYVSDGLLKNNE